MAGTVLAGLLIAVLMRHLSGKVRIAVQVCLVLAWATPILATTTVFQWIFDQQYGILNKTLVKLGFDSFAGFSWFSSGASTLTVIGLLIVWQAVPFVCFTIYAGLLAAPQASCTRRRASTARARGKRLRPCRGRRSGRWSRWPRSCR